MQINKYSVWTDDCQLKEGTNQFDFAETNSAHGTGCSGEGKLTSCQKIWEACHGQCNDEASGPFPVRTLSRSDKSTISISWKRRYCWLQHELFTLWCNIVDPHHTFFLFFLLNVDDDVCHLSYTFLASSCWQIVFDSQLRFGAKPVFASI